MQPPIVLAPVTRIPIHLFFAFRIDFPPDKLCYDGNVQIPGETSLGGADGAFPSTCWSNIRAAGDSSAPSSKQAMFRLCKLYWRPIYALIRATSTLQPDEAKDLTQDFFMELVEGDFLKRVRPELGSFRSYVRGAARHFIQDLHRKARARKRGGGKRLIPLDQLEISNMEAQDPGQAATPEDRFERDWARSVIAHAIDDLEAQLSSEGKKDEFEMFQRYDLADTIGKSESYASLAREYGTTEKSVEKSLGRCRNRLRQRILDRIREYVADDADIGPELAGIMTMLSDS